MNSGILYTVLFVLIFLVMLGGFNHRKAGRVLAGSTIQHAQLSAGRTLVLCTRYLGGVLHKLGVAGGTIDQDTAEDRNDTAFALRGSWKEHVFEEQPTTGMDGVSAVARRPGASRGLGLGGAEWISQEPDQHA